MTLRLRLSCGARDGGDSDASSLAESNASGNRSYLYQLTLKYLSESVKTYQRLHVGRSWTRRS